MEIPAPQFEIYETVEPTPDAAIRPAARVGKVEHRSWVEFAERPGYWRYSVRWPGGGTSSESGEHLQKADRIDCDVKVVVSGHPIKVETWTTENVEHLIDRALLKAGAATHEGVLNWQLRTEKGAELKHFVGDADLLDGKTVLFLDPEVGGGAELRDNPHLPEGYAEKLTGELAEGAGWKGTPPAEGTRRKLILDALEAFSLRLISGDEPGPSSCLGAADAVESALLQSTIDDEAMARGAEALTAGIVTVDPALSLVDLCREQKASHHRLRVDDPGFREYHRGAELAYGLVLERLRRQPEAEVPPETGELRVVIRDVAEPGAHPEYVFVEIENEKGASVGFPMVKPDDEIGPEFRHIVIPYGRDDGWVTEVAYQAAGAATRPLLEDHPDYVFPAERVQEAVAYLLSTFGVPRACTGCQEEQLEHGRNEAADAPAEDRGDDAPTKDHCAPDEFSCATAACERLMERLEEGPVPNAAELARVIDILRNGNGAAYRLSPAMAEALGGIEDRLSEIRDGVRD